MNVDIVKSGPVFPILQQSKLFDFILLATYFFPCILSSSIRKPVVVFVVAARSLPKDESVAEYHGVSEILEKQRVAKEREAQSVRS